MANREEIGPGSDAMTDEAGELASLLAEIDALKARLGGWRLADNVRVRDALLVEYAYESNRIEGNTLTLRETDLVIHKGLMVGGKSMQEHLEAINHHEASLFLLDFARGGEPFTERTVKSLHALILHGIDHGNAGRYRSVPVMISGSRHVPPGPLHVLDLMDALFQEIPHLEARMHPVVLAAEVHERIATIHPFVDGNGRTARLCMNLLLLRAGHGLANIPGETVARRAYYDALEACYLGSSKVGFHVFVARSLLETSRRLVGILESA